MEIDILNQPISLINQLVQGNPSSLIIVDAQTEDRPIVYVNSAFEESTGYPLDEIIGQNCRFLQGEDRDQPERHVMKEALDKGEACMVTLRNYRKSGEMFWNELRIAPIHDTEGVLTHFIGIQNDVTARKFAELQLQQSEEKYRYLAENTSDGIIVLGIAPDPDKTSFASLHTINYASPAFDRQSGRQVGDTMRIGIDTLVDGVHPMDLAHLNDQFMRAIRSGFDATTIQFRCRHIDGHYIWKEDHIRLMYAPEGDYTGAYIVSRDISNRKREEQALRQNEALLQSILTSKNTYILRTGMDGNYSYANEAMFYNFDWMFDKPEDIIGSYSLDTIIPEDHALAAQTVADCLMNPGKSVQVTLRKPTAGDGFRHVLWEFVTINDEAGIPNEIQCVGIDITERHKAEEQRHQLELEKERLKLLTLFIRDASHEFRTPLTIINTNAQILENQNGSADKRNRTQQIQDQVQRMTDLVDMLLLQAQLEQPNPLHRTETDINKLAEIIEAELGREAPDQPVSTTITSNLPIISADSERLLAALRQIADNAVRYSNPGDPISISTGRADQRLWLEIADSGAGIPNGDQGQIFTTFWRADTAHSTAGFGLGLSITEKIVDLHDGTITLESAIGQGSRFRIYLPITD